MVHLGIGATMTDKPMIRQIENYEALMEQLLRQLDDVGESRIPHVHPDLENLYCHFFDEDDNELGWLAAGKAAVALWDDVYLWHEGGPDVDEDDEDAVKQDLDIREAVRIELRSH